MTRVIILLRAKLVHSRRGQQPAEITRLASVSQVLPQIQGSYLWLSSKPSEGNKQSTLRTQRMGDASAKADGKSRALKGTQCKGRGAGPQNFFICDVEALGTYRNSQVYSGLILHSLIKIGENAEKGGSSMWAWPCI